MALLEVKDLEVNYGLIKAIKGVSFEVNEGEIVALIGANGAGKTTIMHAVNGIIPKAAGTVSFNGVDITHTSAHKLVYSGLAQVPREEEFFRSFRSLKIFKWAIIRRKVKKSLQKSWKRCILTSRFLRIERIK